MHSSWRTYQNTEDIRVIIGLSDGWDTYFLTLGSWFHLSVPHSHNIGFYPTEYYNIICRHVRGIDGKMTIKSETSLEDSHPMRRSVWSFYTFQNVCIFILCIEFCDMSFSSSYSTCYT